MATWEDQLQPASLRGVAFDALVSELTFGRRLAKHEYPGRDKPWFEDLGRKARAFQIEAVIVGADYMARRDALINALEQAGPAKVVHPYFGALTVSIDDGCKCKESTDRGGTAHITFTCHESGDAVFPTQAVNTTDFVASQVTATQAAAQDAYASTVSVDQQRFVADASGSLLTKASTAMQQAVSTVQAQADQVAAFIRSTSVIQQDLLSFITDPASAAQALVSNLQQLTRQIAATPADAMSLARTFFNFGFDLPAVPLTTPSRQAQASNQASLVQLVRAAAVAEAAQAASAMTFDSFQDAQALRDELCDAIDDQMMTASDDVFDALRDLRAALAQDIAARGADLARLVTITTIAATPAAVLAWKLYANSTAPGQSEDDIVARNGIAHPLFIAAALQLEVLANA